MGLNTLVFKLSKWATWQLIVAGVAVIMALFFIGESALQIWATEAVVAAGGETGAVLWSGRTLFRACVETLLFQTAVFYLYFALVDVPKTAVKWPVGIVALIYAFWFGSGHMAKAVFFMGVGGVLAVIYASFYISARKATCFTYFVNGLVTILLPIQMTACARLVHSLSF